MPSQERLIQLLNEDKDDCHHQTRTADDLLEDDHFLDFGIPFEEFLEIVNAAEMPHE